MRVLLVTDALPPLPRGGLDLHVRELAAALRARGIDAQLCPLAGDAADAGIERAGDLLPGSRMVRSIRSEEYVGVFRELLRERDPDAVHFHNLQGLSTRLPEEARRFGCQVVWTHHDFFSLCQRVHLHKADGSPCDGPREGVACGPCLGGVKGLLASPVFAMRHASFLDALRKTHAHVAPSRFVREVLIREGKVEPERVHVIPPAVPRPAGLAALPERAGPARVVYAGDLRRAKGADLAIEAMRYLDPGRVRLEVHGGPPAPPAPAETAFEAELRSAAEGLPVSFHGRYGADELARRLDGATALVLPSRVRETFGRTLNLAQQLGVPVVAADHGAPPEFVTEGLSGTLFLPGDPRSLARALARVVQEGILMQADFERWPSAPDLGACAKALLPLYVWRP